MRPRPTPRPSPPEKPVYFAVDLPGRGRHDLRLPLPLYTAAVFRALNAADIVDMKDPAFAAEHPAAQLAILRACGLAIGTAWLHATLDLDADLNAYGDDLAGYGQAVIDELHDEGYTSREVSELHNAVIRRMSASLHTASEVDKRAGFFSRPPGQASSSPSTSASTSSAAIPSASTPTRRRSSLTSWLTGRSSRTGEPQ